MKKQADNIPFSDRLVGIIRNDLMNTLTGITAEKILLGTYAASRTPVSPCPGKPAYMQHVLTRHIMPELCILLRGNMVIARGKAAYALAKYDYCFIPRMMDHYETYAAPAQPYEVLWFGMNRIGGLWLLLAAYGQGRYTISDVIHFKLTPGALKFLTDLDSDEAPKVAWLKEQLTSLYAVLSRKLEEKQYSVSHYNRKVKTWRDKTILKVQQYIVDNITRKFTRQELADHIEVTPRYLTQLFKAEYGSSLFDYINFKKLERSLVLLQDTTKTVSQIAADLSFGDIYYFSKLFKQFFGISPKTFRDSHC